MKPARFLLVNQFLPPDPAPTARLLGEVAEELGKRGHEIVFVGDQAAYRGGKTLCGSRALREGLALVRLWRKTVTAPRCDVLVCLSSPPLLPVAVRAAAFRHGRASLVHWAMDLYPEVAVALGEVRAGSLLHRITARAMERVCSACAFVIALDPDMAERIGPRRARVETIPPWPPEVTIPEKVARAEQAPFVWLYSGNLGRAHEWRTLLEAQKGLEEAGAEIDLVFQGGGPERDAARRHAEVLGLRRCHWRQYAPETDLLGSLLSADALVVTQRPETIGCLWPSKLALALLSGRPVIWVGASAGSIAAQVRREGHHAFAPGESEALRQCLQNLAHEHSLRPPTTDLEQIRHRVRETRQRGISHVADRLESLVRPDR